MALKLDVLANTRQLVSEMKKGGTSIEDVSDALDDLARDGDGAGEKLEKSFKDLAREARQSGGVVEDSIGKSFKKADRDVQNFGSNARDELRDSAREGAASFDGEISDVGDVLQETAANLGPAGLIGAGLIGALTAVATQSVEAWNEKIQGIKDATAEMWADASAEGQGYIDAEAVRAETARLLWDKSLEEQFRAAQSAGISRAELATALATGEGETYDRVHEAIMAAREEERQAALDSMAASTDGNVALQDATAAVNSELARTVTILEEKASATEANKKTAADVAEAEKLQQQELREQIARTRAAAQTRYEEMAKQWANPIKGRVQVDVGVNDRALRDLEQRAARGLRVNVTALNGGRVWQ